MKSAGALFFIVITCLMHFWFILHPSSALHVYQNGIFPVLRFFFDNTFGRIPVPFVYIIIIFLSLFLVKKLYTWLSVRPSWKTWGKEVLFQGGKLVLIVIALFFWMWGFHYYQQDLEYRLGKSKSTMDRQYLQAESEKIVKALNALRDSIPEKAIQNLASSEVRLEDELRKILVPLLKKFGWNTEGKVRVFGLKPKGLLLRFSTAGIYLPYSLEGHYDQGLHGLQIPFTLAHEMAHGYGVTGEGDCNLLALLVTLQSKDPVIRYSGLLTYYRYVRSDDRIAGYSALSEINEQVKNDIRSIWENGQKYPDIFPFWKDYVYDWYLRILGVEDGVENYYRLIDQFFLVKEAAPHWVPESLK